MRRALHMFALLMLLLGGTHLLEPAEARAELAGALHCAEAGAAHDCHEVPHGESDESAHVGHHHCPLAVDDLSAPAIRSAPAADLLFAGRVVPLASRGRAPPLEPPAA